MKQWHEQFETRTRSDGKQFVCQTDDAHPMLQALMLDIHNAFGGCLPNDWLYQETANAFYGFEVDGVDIEDLNVEPDIYYSHLIEWLHNPYALDCCDEYQDELGCDKSTGITERISCGQWLAKDRVWRMVWDFLQEQSRPGA